MHKFFAINLIDNNFILFENDIKQIINVLKLKNNSNIICIFKNNFYLTKIIFKNKKIYFNLIKKLENNNESIIKITIIMSLIKNKNNWNFFLQKATELGIEKIIPFQFINSVVKFKKNDFLNKSIRWKKICKEASEQSFRNCIPEIININNDYKKIINFLSDINIICYEKEKIINSIKKKIFNKINNFKTATIIIGPEGGFDEKEIIFFKKNNFKSVSLGKRILRSETAAIVSIFSIIYEKEF